MTREAPPPLAGLTPIPCLGCFQTLFKTDSLEIIYPVPGREAKNHTLCPCIGNIWAYLPPILILLLIQHCDCYVMVLHHAFENCSTEQFMTAFLCKPTLLFLGKIISLIIITNQRSHDYFACFRVTLLFRSILDGR